MRMRYAALAAPFLLVAALAATILLASCSAPQPTSATPQTTTPSPRDAPATPITPMPPDRCTTPTDPTCILAVYKGAPNDYAQVKNIPDSVLIQPDDDGRYQVERGYRITVVTAAWLPTGYRHFNLQRRPLQGTVSPTSRERLIPPSGTTYTFTVTTDEAASNLISFDLTAARARPQPGQKPELGDIVVTTEFLVPTLRYDTLDTTGAATTPGSYAFLKTAGNTASAISNFGNLPLGSVELRIHPTDASGTSRAAFYDTVQVGDTFDYRTNGLRCGFRFRVTSVPATGAPTSFGIEDASGYGYGGSCDYFPDDPGAAKDVQFVWRTGPGIPSPDGVPVLLYGEPTGKGTYRLDEAVSYVIDIPAGIVITFGGMYHIEPDPDDPDQPRKGLLLIDVETGSVLHIDPDTGRESKRITTSRAVSDLFDQIIASIRMR